MSSDATITWDPPPVHLHNGIIREYLVEIMKDGESDSDILKSGTTSILLANLRPDSTYYVRVAGHTVGAGPYSTSVLFHTLEDGTYVY